MSAPLARLQAGRAALCRVVPQLDNLDVEIAAASISGTTLPPLRTTRRRGERIATHLLLVHPESLDAACL
jgi:hypothetical protein